MANDCFWRLLGLGASCLALANCANGNMSSRVDPNSVTITTTADARHEHDQIIRNADRAAIRMWRNLPITMTRHHRRRQTPRVSAFFLRL